MSKNTLSVIEFFSGIGSQAKALRNIGVNYEIVNTCEWNLHAIAAYERIHDVENGDYESEINNMTKEELVQRLNELGLSNDGKKAITINSLKAFSEESLRKIYSAVLNTKNLVDISRVKASDLPEDIDILTYSFPCQDLSNVGAFHGYNKGIDRDANNRSGMLWEVERILLEYKESGMQLPKFLLMENVPALNSSRHKKNFEEWQNQLNELGYTNQQYLLNAKDFGLPQNRERLLMISVLTDHDEDAEEIVKKYFNEKNLSRHCNLDYNKKQLCDLLRLDYSNPVYLAEAIESQPNDTESRRKIWDENLKIVDESGQIATDYVATITTKQDRHPNSGNIKVDFDNGKSEFRYLTPRECFLLMGFDESDYEKVINQDFTLNEKRKSSIFSRDSLIKMAGNSIPVNLLELVFQQIVELRNEVFL